MIGSNMHLERRDGLKGQGKMVPVWVDEKKDASGSEGRRRDREVVIS